MIDIRTIKGKSKPAFRLSAILVLFILLLGTYDYWRAAETGSSKAIDESAQANTIASPVITSFDDNDTLHIHFISGSEEYKSESSLKRSKQRLEQDYQGIKVTASWGEDRGSELPGIEQLADADLMVVFTRRMTLPEDQLRYILQHIEDEKPIIGIRTASHAFQDFLELDEIVFGGDYDGHGDDEPVKLSIAKGAEEHPILNGVQSWTRPGKIYHNPELGPDTQVLFYGEGMESGINEPMAWTNHYGENGRAFYTSMGFPDDFENDNFLRMLLNSISWTTGRHVLPNTD